MDMEHTVLILILIKALSNFDLDIEEISRFQAQASFLRKLSCLHFWLQQMAFQHKPLEEHICHISRSVSTKNTP